jgi:hypothetical protein
MRAQIEGHLTKPYFYKIFRMRSSQDESIFYFDANIFGKYFDRSSPTFYPPVIQPKGLEGVGK